MTTFTQIGAVGTTDNFEVAPHWLGVLILTVFAVVVIAIFIFMAKDFIMQVLSKRITTTATLASKFQEEYVNKRMYAGTGAIQEGLAEKGIAYYFTMNLDTGKIVTFPVSKDMYDVYAEGTKGILTYKYKTLMSFEAETEGTKAEGGNITISLEDYAACNINIAKGKKADLVDVEVMSNSEEKKKLVAELQKEGVKVIASSHDFHKTDSQEVLLNRFREMEKSGADILKMAVMPHGFEDVAAIMEATNVMRQECEKPLVSMAMGSIGSITRISGENFGSGITFGTVGAASAPGQFPIGELRSLLDALHEKNEEDELKQ